MLRKFLSTAVLLALAAAPRDMLAQERQITGRVTVRGTDQPLPEATVGLLGQAVGVRTNQNGEFRLRAPAGEVVLIARAVTFKRATVRVPAGQDNVTIALEKDVLQLEGVTVTGQATAIGRENAATATDQVSAAELVNTPAVSFENALQGKVTGANINMNSGAPGGGGQIQIRGVTSILGQGDPLIVVDGVIVSNASVSGGQNALTLASPGGGAPAIGTNQDNPISRLADINMNEVESVEVLKAAAASAIYGSKATNGVIVITTKRGRAGTPQFNVTQRVGSYNLTRKLGSRRFNNVNDDVAAGSTYQDSLSNARRDNQRATLEAAFSEGIADSVLAMDRVPYYDYQGDLFGHGGLSHETILNLSGGTENTRYFASVTDKRDGGTLLNTAARRQGLRINVDQTFGSRFTVAIGANISRSNANRGLSNNDNTYTSPIYLFGYMPAVIDLNRTDAAGRYVENPLFGGGSAASNPFQTFSFIKNEEDVFRLLGSGRVDMQAYTSPTHNIRLNLQGGVDRYDQDNQLFSPTFLQFEPNDGDLGTSVQANSVSRQVNGSVNGVYQFTPTSGLFAATTSVGVQYEERRLNTYRIRARGLVPSVPNINQGRTDVFQNRTQDRANALYASQDVLAFNERLYVSGAVRAERSSLNAERDRQNYYPRGQASYRFVNPFARVNEFKLRASYGKSGNNPRFGDREETLAGAGVIGGRNGVVANTVIGNSNIKPERMAEQEYGFDASFFDSRLGLEYTYFDRTITDLLLQPALAPTSGFSNQVINGGRLRTNGNEFGLSLVPVKTERFNWVSRASYYQYKGVIENLPVPSFLVGSSGFGPAFGRSRISCVRPVDANNVITSNDCRSQTSVTSIWGNRIFDTLRVFNQQGERLLSGAGGDSVLLNVRRDTIIGDARPDFQMAFTNEFTVGPFALNTLLDWRKGGDMSNMTQTLFDEGGNSWDYDKPCPENMRQRDNATEAQRGEYGILLGECRYNAWRGGSDARTWIQDGSFVKLREVTLSYQVPKGMLGRIPGGARDLRVSLSGRNLAIWSDYWSFDPEVNNFGNQNVTRIVDLAPFPPTKSFFFSVDVGF